MHPTDLPAVPFLLGYPLFQDDPNHKRTISAVRQVVVTLQAGLETRECVTSIRVHRSEPECACTVLTGGPSFPGEPCIPFFPWGPYETEVSQWITKAPHEAGKNPTSLTFSPGSPTKPCGPGKPCRRDRAFLFQCTHSCDWDIFLSGLCSYHDSRVALLSRCSGVSWGSLFRMDNDVL